MMAEDISGYDRASDVYKDGEAIKKVFRDPITGYESKADQARREIWAIPRDTMPLVSTEEVTYVTKDERWVTTEMVYVKAKNAKKALENAEKEFESGAWDEMKWWRHYQAKRPNFNMDVVREQSRAGQRAFRYRNGQLDLRMAPNDRRFLQDRLPDMRRKRNRFGWNYPKMVKFQTGKKYVKGSWIQPPKNLPTQYVKFFVKGRTVGSKW